MNIGDVSQLTGLPAKTIRYYEDIDLVVPARQSNGYRDYSEANAHTLAFLGRARSLGFSIEDCRALLALWNDRARSSGEVRRIATDHLDRIEVKIAELAGMRDTLRDLLSCCHGDERPDCPILEDLALTGAPRELR